MKSSFNWIPLALITAAGLAGCQQNRLSAVTEHASGPHDQQQPGQAAPSGQWPSGMAGGSQPAPPRILREGEAEGMAVAAGRNWSPGKEPEEAGNQRAGISDKNWQSATVTSPGEQAGQRVISKHEVRRGGEATSRPGGMRAGQASNGFASDGRCDSWEASSETRERFDPDGRCAR